MHTYALVCESATLKTGFAQVKHVEYTEHFSLNVFPFDAVNSLIDYHIWKYSQKLPFLANFDTSRIAIYRD